MTAIMTENYNLVAQKLNDANSVLLVLPQAPSFDVVAAGLALSNYLKKLDKDAVLLATDTVLPSALDFLPGYTQIVKELNVSKGFVINVSTKKVALSELSYKKEADNLAIFLKPKTGEFAPEDVSFSASRFPYDAVVVLGAASLENLGQFYAKNAQLFFETPVINIDHRGINQGYGQLNLVELNASSVSEIVYDLLAKMEHDLLDQDVATSLLTGIISETNSFQATRTTPQSFMKASQLVGFGANQQDIVNRLYKNKSMNFLKLWGSVLAKLKHESENSLIFSYIQTADVEKTGATTADMDSVITEMGQQLSFAKSHLFFVEQGIDQTTVYVTAPTSIDLKNIFAQYQTVGIAPNTMKFYIPQALQVAQESVLNAVRPLAKKTAK